RNRAHTNRLEYRHHDGAAGWLFLLSCGLVADPGVQAMTRAASAGNRKIPDPNIAFPPRFWWLKRIALLVLIAIAAVTALRWWWGREADRRLAAIVADARARAEPILPEEFEP